MLAGETPASGPDTEVTMSSSPPSNGTFFVEQPQPAPAPAVTPEPPVAVPAAVPPVQAAPAAHVAETPAPAAGGAMRDVPLGTLIFRAGLLAEEQLEDALHAGMQTGKRLGEVLLERGLIREEELGRLLAGQKGLPFVELGSVALDPAAVQLLPEEKARMQHALAIGFDAGMPVVAVADPTNELVVENVKRALGADPKLVVAAHGDLGRKIDEAFASAMQAHVVPAPVDLPVVEPAAAVEQPAPVVTPMPTVVPPAEERVLQPPPAAVVPQPPPVAMQPAQPAAELPPLTEPAPAAPQAVAQPVTPPVVETPPPPVEPAAPAEAPVPIADQGLFTQATDEALAPLTAPAPVAPPQPEPVPPAPQATQAVAPTHFVLLRLTDAEVLEVGGFATPAEAQDFARSVVGHISRAEEQAEWPFFAGRFVRPQTIVSVDIVETAGDQWLGSAVRNRWANESPSAL